DGCPGDEVAHVTAGGPAAERRIQPHGHPGHTGIAYGVGVTLEGVARRRLRVLDRNEGGQKRKRRRATPSNVTPTPYAMPV
ncbi:hypothetical protein, partial [Streptomyces ipomoeae]|uniref:hypothetical protein n=1 Tax=Streptomyces ipomoeae TaxID=103232 RepID=UPI0029A1E9D2